MDRAEVLSLSDELATAAGKFLSCLKTEESSAIESGRECKVYAPGIGLIQDAGLKLTRYGFASSNNLTK